MQAIINFGLNSTVPLALAALSPRNVSGRQLGKKIMGYFLMPPIVQARTSGSADKVRST